MTATEIRQLAELVETMRHLRSEDGCSWDREQTPESLRPYILEEAYELVDAIDSGDIDDILAELGDLLLQVIFQAQLYSEKGLFGIGKIAEGINCKLRRRHPHIFSANKIAGQYPDWEQIKQQELAEKGKPSDFRSRMPINLPSLKMADKACRYLQKNDTNQRTATQVKNLTEETLAEAIFNLVSDAQQNGIDSDLALRKYVLNLLKQQQENVDQRG